MNDSGTVFTWQIGRVVDGDDGSLLLEFADPAACSRCRRGRGCGAGQFARLFGRARPLRLPAESEAGLVPGQLVRVGIDSRWLLAAAAVAYLLPLLAFVLGAVLAGSALGGGDFAALAGGLVAVLVGWFSTRRLAPELLQPRLQIGEVLESAPTRNHLEPEPGSDGPCTRYSNKPLEE